MSGRRTLAVAMALATSVAVFTVAAPAKASSPVPGQFIAKLYAEALGRMPDPAGWNGHVQYFSTLGCGHATLAQTVRAFYNGPEFLGLGYDNASKVLALYRGALNRDADQAGLNHHTNLLNTGAITWPGLVEAFIGTAEFVGLIGAVCGPSTSYYYGTAPAPELPLLTGGHNPRTGAALQAIIDQTPAGGVVHLAQRAVVRITQPLVIKAGVTVVTAGAPTPRQYLLQARLVREGPLYRDAFVKVQSGARLLHVWVDGHRGNPANHLHEAFNVALLGGTGTEISQSRVSETTGGSSIVAYQTGEPCVRNVIAYNLVTSWSAAHAIIAGASRWADGITVACGGTTVVGNGIIDASDVALILFLSTPFNQASQAVNNQVLSAGNSAFSALAANGEFKPVPTTTHTFYGAQVSNNLLWTSPNTHFQIGLEIGTRPHFGNLSEPGIGATFNGNATPPGTYAIVSTGIAVSGMYSATVQGNGLALIGRPVSACPVVAIGIDAHGFAAGSNIQPGGVFVSFLRPGSTAGCVGL